MPYFYWKAPTHNCAKFNRALHFWIGHYNAHRLHGGLGYMNPLEKLQNIRLKFLESQPTQEGNKQDRQIQAFEKELQALLALVA